MIAAVDNTKAPASPGEWAAAADDATRLGMLMEAAHLQQQLAESALTRLESHARGLDEVVRDEIRQSFTSECVALDSEVQKATIALQALRRAAERRAASWTVVILASVASATIAVIQYALPSAQEIAKLRGERDSLGEQIQQLTQSGGRLQLRRCGAQERLCVRIDRSAPSYGAAGDYLVVKGY